MGIAGGPNLNQDGLVFLYDVFDQDNSYKGEPTTNLATDSPSDVGGWGGYYLLVDSATKSFNLRVNDGGAGSAWKSFYWNVSSYIGQYITITANYTFGTQYNCNFQHITVGQGNTGPYPIHIAGSDEVDRLTISSKTSQQITWSGVINATGIVGFTVWLADASAGAYTICNVSNVQIEAKSHKTPFINGTRSSTQGLLDVAGTNQIDISNASFDVNAQMYFDGTNDSIETPFETILNDCSIELWFKATSTGIYQYPLAIRNNSAGSTYSFYLDMNDPDGGGVAQTIWTYWNSGGSPYSVVPKTGTYGDWNDSTWRHYVFTRSTSSSPYTLHYMNGSLVSTINRSGDQTTQFGNGAGYKLYLGQFGANSNYFTGNIPSVKIYNRVLSAQEVLQNYNATKSRFGLK